MTSKLGWSAEDHDKENGVQGGQRNLGAPIVIGVCREDNPRDVDEAYGAGTYDRLFPQPTEDADEAGSEPVKS
jgi:hypothetical protein